MAACSLSVTESRESHLLPRFTDGVRVTSMSIRRNPSAFEKDFSWVSAWELRTSREVRRNHRSALLMEPSELHKEMTNSN